LIIEGSGLNGLQAELADWDEASSQLGFVRWQWEYYRATYDLKIEAGKTEYFLRINTRAIEGKLESPAAVLEGESMYIGIATFPHGLDYEAAVPDSVLKIANQKLAALKQLLQA
jgi:hypothetical protein